MRRVVKGEEPRCLADVRREVRRIEGASRVVLEETGEPDAATKSLLEDRWAEVKTGCKASIRATLIRDQGGLCAYCGVPLKIETMKVEHFVPRAADRELILDWRNLLGCCPGVYRGQDGNTVSHCDSSRSPYAEGPPVIGLLNTHPASSLKSPERVFRVNTSSRGGALGVISGATSEAEADVKELNLNAPQLVRNRANTIRRLRVELNKMEPKKARRLLERRHASATMTAGRLPAYAHVIAAYTSRKLRQYSQS